MTELTLNKVMVDWLTFTSFFDDIYKHAVILSQGADTYESRSQQYVGWSMDMVSGGLWAGTGRQRAGLHNMVRMWGESSHNALASWAAVFNPWRDRCKRIDYQITIEQPDGWSQWALAQRLRERGVPVGWPTPQRLRDGREMATVYMFTRKGSNRYARVYQKLSSAGNMLLRLEVELKEDRAAEHAKHIKTLADGDMGIGRDELAYTAQHDTELYDIFYHALEGNRRPVKVKQKDSDTAGWLLNTCAPSLERYLNSHSSDESIKVLEYYIDIIGRHMDKI